MLGRERFGELGPLRLPQIPGRLQLPPPARPMPVSLALRFCGGGVKEASGCSAGVPPLEDGRLRRPGAADPARDHPGGGGRRGRPGTPRLQAPGAWGWRPPVCRGCGPKLQSPLPLPGRKSISPSPWWSLREQDPDLLSTRFSIRLALTQPRATHLPCGLGQVPPPLWGQFPHLHGEGLYQAAWQLPCASVIRIMSLFSVFSPSHIHTSSRQGSRQG